MSMCKCHQRCVCVSTCLCVCVCVRHLTWMVCVSLHEWGSLCICVSVTGLDLVTDEFVQVCVNIGVCVCVCALSCVSVCEFRMFECLIVHMQVYCACVGEREFYFVLC